MMCWRQLRNITKGREQRPTRTSRSKESLKYTLRTNIYPSWLWLKLQCHVNLPNLEDNEEIVQFWKETQKPERQKTWKPNFESSIEKKNKEINNVRSRTFQKLGSKIKFSADTIKAQEEHTKALEAFRDNFHNGQSSFFRDTPRLEPTTYRRPRGRGTFHGMRQNKYKPYWNIDRGL